MAKHDGTHKAGKHKAVAGADQPRAGGKKPGRSPRVGEVRVRDGAGSILWEATKLLIGGRKRKR